MAQVMRIKHLMSETSGIGYEQWTDYQAPFSLWAYGVSPAILYLLL